MVKPIVGGAVQYAFGGLGYVAQLVADKAYDVLPGFGKAIIDGAQNAGGYISEKAKNAIGNVDALKEIDLFEGIDAIAYI